jgi:hypothetical protein
MELRTNRANRGNAIGCQLPGEYLRCLLAQRVRGIRAAGHAARYRLGTADDHHQQLVAADQRDRRPRRNRRASAGTDIPRRAESSITIELA